MKSLLILIISSLPFALLPTKTTAQTESLGNSPLIITIGEEEIEESAQQLFEIILTERIPHYPEVLDDIVDFLTDAIDHRPHCSGLSNCPPTPSPLIQLESGNLFRLAFPNLISSSTNYDLQAGYIKLDTPASSINNSFNGVTSVTTSSYAFPYPQASNTILLFSIVGTNGRGSIQAIIIADKHILRAEN